MSQPTVSGQIAQLEKSFGEKLFKRQGRRLVLTDAGRLVYDYAEDIFTTGEELLQVFRSGLTRRRSTLRVGIADVVPKMASYKLLQPAFARSDSFHLVCHEGKPADLLSELGVHRLDLVLSDVPMSPDVSVRAYSHLLGECGVTFYGSPELVGSFDGDLVQGLRTFPVLLPTSNTSLRRELDIWFQEHDVEPTVVAEFEDSALMKTAGLESVGIFPVPSIVEEEVQRQYHVLSVGRIEEKIERFFLISVERRLKHPALLEISRVARKNLFS